MPMWKELLAAAKADCLVGLWSKGAELARDGAVSGQEQGADGWIFRVRASGRGIAPTVHLYPQDREWECDCNGSFDPCEHVVACVIAVAATPDAAATLIADAGRNGGLRYELRAGEQGLEIARFLTDGHSADRALEEPLSTFLARRSPEVALATTHADLAIDRLLGHSPPGPLSFDNAVALLRLLTQVGDLRLDGAACRASGEPLYPRASVVDAPGGGVELVVEADPAVTRVVAPGVLLHGDTLHPFGAHARFGKRWERLPFRRVFPPSELAELVGTVLPELERHIPIDVDDDTPARARRCACALDSIRDRLRRARHRRAAPPRLWRPAASTHRWRSLRAYQRRDPRAAAARRDQPHACDCGASSIS